MIHVQCSQIHVSEAGDEQVAEECAGCGWEQQGCAICAVSSVILNGLCIPSWRIFRDFRYFGSVVFEEVLGRLWGCNICCYYIFPWIWSLELSD